MTAHEDYHVRVNLLSDPKYSFETQLDATSPIVSLQYNDNVIYATQANGEISTINVHYEEGAPYLDEP